MLSEAQREIIRNSFAKENTRNYKQHKSNFHVSSQSQNQLRHSKLSKAGSKKSSEKYSITSSLQFPKEVDDSKGSVLLESVPKMINDLKKKLYESEINESPMLKRVVTH